MINLTTVKYCYQHVIKLGSVTEPSIFKASKVVCVAKNFSHLLPERSASLASREANAAIFLKPPSALCSIYNSLQLETRSDIVCETELALLITKRLNQGSSTDDEIISAVGGFAVAFDLTKKDMQNTLKADGKPWELAKGFDNACPISEFISLANDRDFLRNMTTTIQLSIDGKLALSQTVGEMILSPIDLTRLISRHFTLCPGDVILTGTPTRPSDPPRLSSGNSIEASIGDIVTIKTQVA